MHWSCNYFKETLLPPRRTNENLDLRLSFIQNQITVDVFKAELERRDKTKTKRMEIYQVMDTLSIVGTEIIKNIRIMMETMHKKS